LAHTTDNDHHFPADPCAGHEICHRDVSTPPSLIDSQSQRFADLLRGTRRMSWTQWVGRG
jgi:hypothetical protein